MEGQDVDRPALAIDVEGDFGGDLPSEVAKEADDALDELGVATVAESIQPLSLEEHPHRQIAAESRDDRDRHIKA